MDGVFRAAVAAVAIALALASRTPAQEPAPELDLGAPEGAVVTARSDRTYDSYALPVAPFGADPAASVRHVEGRVIWSGYRLAEPGASTAEVMAGYREHLSSLGYAPLLDCANAACGGFDFRFGAQLLPAPTMLVDAADFAQFSARMPGPGDRETYASVLVSRVLGAIHVQTVVVAPGAPGVAIGPAPAPTAASESPVILAQDEARLLERLNADGHVPVDGLMFETGGAALSEGSAPAIELLAQLLARNAELSVVIVGHSDNQGTLDSNLALSQRRAEAVRDALVGRGVAAARLEAKGIGYLAPVTTNVTEEGRQRNRRVELVLR